MLLLLTQQLGLVHRIAHGPVRVASVDHAGLPAAATIDAKGDTQWVENLFSGHGSETGCQLFDGHGQGPAPVVPTLVLPAAIAVGVVRLLQIAFVPVSPTPFEARGPPSLR